MNHLVNLEKKFGKFVISNLTYYLIVGQVFAFMIKNLYPVYAGIFTLSGRQILADGQWWRVLTFLFEPLSDNFLFIVFTWYVFYMYGSALERLWGSFRYTVYLLISYIGTVILAFIFPQAELTNSYLYSSIFLAFAYLFPDFKMLLFFIIPIKIKWLSLLVWAGVVTSLLFGDVPTKVLTVVSLINFLIFFGEDFVLGFKNRSRSFTQASPIIGKPKAYHICTVCGKNEVDNPTMEIIYCSKCTPSLCYCEDHIRTHTHRIVN